MDCHTAVYLLLQVPLATAEQQNTEPAAANHHRLLFFSFFLSLSFFAFLACRRAASSGFIPADRRNACTFTNRTLRRGAFLSFSDH